MVTVLTRTIGPSGRDYASFTLAEADVTNIGTSGDLVANDEAIVFKADAADYSGNFQFFTGGALTCDATRNVTWTHASGAEHGGQFESGANIVGYCLIQEDHAVVDGLSVSPSSGFASQVTNGAEGAIFRNLMSYSTNSTAIKLQLGGSSASPCVVENCVGKSDSSRPLDIRAEGTGDSHWRVVSNTIICGSATQGFFIGSSSSGTIYLEATNNLILSTRGWYASPSGYTLSLTGTNNFGPASNPVPSSIEGTPNPITATTDAEGTPAAGDYAIHDSNGRLYNITTNDVWQAGIGPASDSDVPTTDILGATRSGTTANPGAFELGVGESNEPPALPGLANATPDFRVHLDRRVTDATTGVSSTYDASANTTTFTLPYKLNTAATMQVVTRKTSGANAGQSLTVVSTDATNRRVVVSGNHTGTAVFIGEKYTMKYEFSELHLQRNKNTYAAEPITAASHRVRYGRVNYGQTSFFKVTVTPKGGTSSTYVFNGNLLNEPETQLGSVALYDGHFQFPVLADHDRVTIELENDSPLPSRFLSCEWESFYHSRIGSRSRY